jgi:hypothetical protein
MWDHIILRFQIHDSYNGRMSDVQMLGLIINDAEIGLAFTNMPNCSFNIIQLLRVVGCTRRLIDKCISLPHAQRCIEHTYGYIFPGPSKIERASLPSLMVCFLCQDISFMQIIYLGQYDITLIKGRKGQEEEEVAKGSIKGINIPSFTSKKTVEINGWGCSS